METTRNTLPRTLTETTEAVCASCGALMFTKSTVSKLQPDDTYIHTSFVSGSYYQDINEDGQPIGPMIPTCSCKEDNHA